MTTQTWDICPECKLPYDLLEGKLPPHTAQGLPCPMSGREPLEWPLPPLERPTRGFGPEIVDSFPSAGEPLAQVTAPPEPVAAATTPSPTLAEPGGGPRQRKVRSDKGKKRETKPTVAEYEASANIAREARNQEVRIERAARIKLKRTPRQYIVAVGECQAFTSLPAACEALGTRMAEWEQRLEGAEGDPPVLIVGRLLATKYEPPRTIPATVRVVRSRGA